MLTLLMVAALCDDLGCTYMDVTERFSIKSNAECEHVSVFLNEENIMNNRNPRFACLEPSKFKSLSNTKF